jgi:hypothetical protein
MRVKKYLIAIILLVACVTAHAQSAEQVVVDLSEKKFGWMIRMQYDSLEAVLDERLLFTHSNGWTETKPEFIQDIKSGKLRYTNIQVSESSARIYASTAIVNGKGKFRVTLDGNDLEFNLSYTEVYILKNEKWLLASRHANRLP